MKLRILLLSLLTLLFFNIGQSQELIVINSKNLYCNDSIRVYTPQNVNSSTPTLILLHGWSGDYKNWGDKMDLQALSNKTNFRIITPDGFYNSWYLNNTDPEKMQWRVFYDEEFFPLMQKKYNLTPDKTFITGLSMGGHGAINLFLDNPENYAGAGSMSGVLDLQLTSLKSRELPKVVGKKLERIDNESAINRIDKLANGTKPMIITCGTEDIYAKCSENFSAKCNEKNIPHLLKLSPGKHDWAYWTSSIVDHIDFFQKILNKENLGY